MDTVAGTVGTDEGVDVVVTVLVLLIEVDNVWVDEEVSVVVTLLLNDAETENEAVFVIDVDNTADTVAEFEKSAVKVSLCVPTTPEGVNKLDTEIWPVIEPA